MHVIDENMHHGVFGPLLDVIALQQEGMRSKVQFSERVPERIGFETERLVEPQTRLVVPRGKEGTKRANPGNEMSDRVHRRLLVGCKLSTAPTSAEPCAVRHSFLSAW